MLHRNNYKSDRNRLLLVYFGFYYAVLLGFFIDNRLLFQYRPIFFNYNRDLTELALLATGLPRWMTGHPISFPIADLLAFLVPLPIILQNSRNRSFSPWPGILFTIYLVLYLLLADIFWQAHHELYMLFFLLSLVWTTARSDRFYLILNVSRYYFLYLFVSAAIWKIARGAVFNSEEMSRILLLHHADLLTEGCSSLTCRIYGWLISHPAPAQTLYICGVLLEASFVAGFFTRRWDRLLIALAILFVFTDLLIMLIPYWTILLGVIPLWLHAPDPLSMPGKATAPRMPGTKQTPAQY